MFFFGGRKSSIKAAKPRRKSPRRKYHWSTARYWAFSFDGPRVDQNISTVSPEARLVMVLN